MYLPVLPQQEPRNRDVLAVRHLVQLPPKKLLDPLTIQPRLGQVQILQIPENTKLILRNLSQITYMMKSKYRAAMSPTIITRLEII